jgi:hypothetical protein
MPHLIGIMEFPGRRRFVVDVVENFNIWRIGLIIGRILQDGTL